MRNYYYSLKQGDQEKGFAVAYGCGGPNVMPLYYDRIEFYCNPIDIIGTYEVWLIGWAGGELEEDWLCRKGFINFCHGFPYTKCDSKVILNEVWFGEGELHYTQCDKGNDYTVYYINNERHYYE